MEQCAKKRSKMRKTILIALIVLSVLIGGTWILSVVMYNAYFGQRYESYEPTLYRIDDFAGLQCEEIPFASDRGQTLTGYLYRAGEAQRGGVVMAHGFGGGGHNSYMDAANFFAQRGYYVFAFDATGNDKSEGSGTGGMPQGVIDLDYAISFAQRHETLGQLPIVLFGHSWGGYCAGSVLSFHPEVKAAILSSGFNQSMDLFTHQGKQIAGNAIYPTLPFVRLHERLTYGKYAVASVLDGFAASDAAIMVVHSMDDEVVPSACGYERYDAAYGDDPRFTFLSFEDRGHDVLNDPEKNAYLEEINEAYYAWCDTLSYDYAAKENKDRFAAEKAAYIQSHLDRERWSNRLDEALFETFAAFYDAHIR